MKGKLYGTFTKSQEASMAGESPRKVAGDQRGGAARIYRVLQAYVKT